MHTCLGLSKPLLLLVGLVGAVTSVGHFSSKGVFTDAKGKSLDYAGDRLRCQSCGGSAVNRSGYTYRCEKCGGMWYIRLHQDSVKPTIRRLDK